MIPDPEEKESEKLVDYKMHRFYVFYCVLWALCCSESIETWIPKIC